jgi:hypothetical protein
MSAKKIVAMLNFPPRLSKKKNNLNLQLVGYSVPHSSRPPRPVQIRIIAANS